MSAQVMRTGATGAARAFSEIPGPRAWPLVGSTLEYRWGPRGKTAYHLALLDMYRKYGPLVKESLGGKTILHVFDLDDIKTVYSHEGKYPIVPPLQETTQMYRQQKAMSLGLGNTNGEEWYRLRANSQQKMLRPKEVAFHLPSVDAIANDLVKKIEHGRRSDGILNNLKLEIGRWSLENAGSLVFDKRLGCLEAGSSAEDWSKMMVEANAEIFKLSGDLKLSLPLYKYVTTPKWRRLVQAEDRFYTEAIALVDDALLRLTKAVEEKRVDQNQFYFLSYLLSKESLTLKDVTVICLSLFTDGLSTTTPTMLFNLYSLANTRNEESQEKLYEEVSRELPSSAPATPEAIASLHYLKAFVKETFRVWPNGTEVSRYTESDMVLSGYHVPAGTHVDLNPSVHFRDEKIFPDPDKHVPERWLRGGQQTDLHPFLLTPFGHGTRMCAGRRFAEQDLYVVLARIISRFKLEIPAGSELGQTYHTLLFPDRPLHIKFLDRS